MSRRRSIPMLLALLLLAGGCYDSHFGESGEKPGEEMANTSLAGLRELFTGESEVIEGDIRVRGTVTTSDRAGNFYRTLCIEEQEAALEVMVGLDHLHNDYPPGSRLIVRLRGLTLGCQHGILQVGSRAEPGSGYATGYLGSKPAADAAIVRLEGTRPVEAADMGIAELTPARCGTLVRVEGLLLQSDSQAPVAWAGYHLFADASGNLIRTYVRPYADFASGEIPAGRVALTGILQLDGSSSDRYMLKLRDEEDCLLVE